MFHTIPTHLHRQTSSVLEDREQPIAAISRANDVINLPTLVINSDHSVILSPPVGFQEEARTIPPALARGLFVVSV